MSCLYGLFSWGRDPCDMLKLNLWFVDAVSYAGQACLILLPKTREHGNNNEGKKRVPCTDSSQAANSEWKERDLGLY